VAQEKVRDVKIGIAICTFKREPFIEKNLRILNEAILKNPESPLYGHLEVFVADNGQTLDRERLSSDKIHINPNRNLGGAGGFTRDLIEIMTHNDELHVTHALLMDDDIVIEPESLINISDSYTFKRGVRRCVYRWSDASSG
jgi:galactofuranosylgalactofuranosylrhamnosyl-N-acetylglucosaminyl-diphospho-decaprenol beta-1,5/1,6-galactofuranosyltransferase